MTEVQTRIPGLRMIENYIDEATEQRLLSHITSQEFDTTLARRTQHYGYRYTYGCNARLDRALPIPDQFRGIFPHEFDQCIVNEYRPGQGIAKHTDHERLFKERVQIISLGSHTTMIFRINNIAIPVIIQPRSLIIMEGVARYKWTHEIPAVKTDTFGERGTRYSITVREVA